jgi:hypothetical protein
MRLYRGLKEPYRPEKVVPPPGHRFGGTDFTDCPLAALRYANARRGVLLVLDAPPDTLRVTEELWFPGAAARRFMAWGKFDKFLTAVLPAKNLRAFIRAKGVAGQSDEYKAMVLERAIRERLDDAVRQAKSGSATPSP